MRIDVDPNGIVKAASSVYGLLFEHVTTEESDAKVDTPVAKEKVKEAKPVVVETTTQTGNKPVTGSTMIQVPKDSTRIPDSEFMKNAAVEGKVDFDRFVRNDETVDIGKSIAKLADAAIGQTNRVKPKMPNPMGQQAPMPLVQQMPNPMPSAQPAQANQVDPRSVIFSGREYMYEIDNILTDNGKYFVVYTWDNGLLKADVRLSEKPEESIPKRSITFDLLGLIVTPGAKWWPGIKHDRPVDMLPAYKLFPKEIDNYVNGRPIDKAAVLFDQKLGYLNKVVDLRSVTSIHGISDEDVQHMFTKISKAVTSNSLSKQIKKECRGKRFIVKAFTDKNNFTLETNPFNYMSSVKDSYEKMASGKIEVPDKDATVFSLVFENGKPAKLVK